MTPLEKILIQKIIGDGPLGLDVFMDWALGHLDYGYYITRDPFGAAGDFTTAPEISQMFGELIGLWCADLWMQMGKPADFILAECGPGRGTLMADALRTATSITGFIEAAQIHLIETSPLLRKKQKETLHTYAPQFHDNLEGLKHVQGDRPTILIANELLDALPIRQCLWQDHQWMERAVDYDEHSGFKFIWQPIPGKIPDSLPAKPKEGVIYEVGQAREEFLIQAAQLTQKGGAALFIDYGYIKAAPGETLQALKAHKVHDVLKDIGEADLTAHVNFESLAMAGREQGASVLGPVTQGHFLLSLGLAERAQALINAASARLGDSPEADNSVQDIKSAVLRLSSPAAMGQLFKVLCISHDKTLHPAGF